MALYQLLLPKMGESVAEATIIKWAKQIGDELAVDDVVVEIATDKVDSEVPSPVEGKLVELRFNENDIAQVGDVIAIIETAEDTNNVEADVKPTPEQEAEVERTDVGVQPENAAKEEEIPYLPQPESDAAASIDFSTSEKFYSPLVKSIAQEEGISVTELDNIKGSGSDGRVTKDDLLSYIAKRSGESDGAIKQTAQNSQDAKHTTVQLQSPTPVTKSPSRTMTDEIVEMDRMRKVIADHMIHSKDIAAHVTSFVEADVTNLVLWRERVKAAFEKREGEKITFTPIFVEAVTKAIKDMPMINISLNGNQIIKKKDINIGMAAALPNGNLIVPVIKNADQLNLVGLTKAVNDLAKRSRENKLLPDEVKGGTFTLTNIGGFGNIMGTPIINQPQVAILAVGAIKKKPAVLETEYGDVIAIRHLMYLSLSYDHRIVDGSLGGSFVKRVADYLEQWDVNREI
ncbi:MAG TPA: dihydrolipoamide acetyltransferase family protein [Pelobium sp.]